MSAPHCPRCGFTVFNRRYPKCEKCGEPLPDDLVLSKEQVASLQAQESVKDAAERLWQEKERLHDELLRAQWNNDFSGW